MVANNAFIMVGLGLAGLWFMNRQRGSQEDQVGQLTGASMMAAGEGTAPDQPFQTYSGPSDPIFFFNQGGQMTKVPGTNVPLGASSDEDIGIYPGSSLMGSKDDQVGRRTGPTSLYVPELEFTVEKSIPPAGTSDDSPTTPEFAGTPALSVTASTVWDQQALIANANFMPLLAIQDVQGISILGSNVDIATLTSNDPFRGVNVTTGDIFTTTGGVLGEYTAGWQAARAANPLPAVVQQTWQQIEAASGLTSRQATSAPWIERQEWDLDIGI
jgi:hypothetical protein